MQPGFLEQFRQQETGNITVLALFFFLSSVMAGSLAVDFANKAHAQRDLQIIADTAAHAAMRTRLRGDSEQAIDAALEIAGRNAVAGRPAGMPCASPPIAVAPMTTWSKAC